MTPRSDSGEQGQCGGSERGCLDGRPSYPWHRWALPRALLRKTKESFPPVNVEKAWSWATRSSIQKSMLVPLGIPTLISNHREPRREPSQPLALVRGQFRISTVSTMVEFTRPRFTGSPTRGFLTPTRFRPPQGRRTDTKRCAISSLIFTAITPDKRTFSPTR